MSRCGAVLLTPPLVSSRAVAEEVVAYLRGMVGDLEFGSRAQFIGHMFASNGNIRAVLRVIAAFRVDEFDHLVKVELTAVGATFELEISIIAIGAIHVSVSLDSLELWLGVFLAPQVTVARGSGKVLKVFVGHS